jgi:beta-1,4-N-acetylglucosaminyltransferase
MNDKKNKIKIGIVTSKGGHLFQLIQINSLFKKYNRFWISFSGKDTKSYLKKERVYIAHCPESRNLFNAIKNGVLAMKIFHKEKPTHLISSGAGIAAPFFLVAKILFKTKLIYIESYDFVAYPSLTGRIIYNIADLFIVQHRIQKKWFKKAKYWGSLL